MLGWLKRRRRRRLADRPFPETWDQFLRATFLQFAWLSADDRKRLQSIVQVLVAEKYWEGCNGLMLTDEHRVTIAAQAALLLIGFEEEYFSRLVTILVYPGVYVAKEKKRVAFGIEEESDSARLGEAWHTGVVVLSWPDVVNGGQHPTDGRNVVFHEFAHVLDAADHQFDGTPDLLSSDQLDTWREVMTAEYRHLVRAAHDGRWTLLDRYGAQNEAEFFAVATECFFERPHAMQNRHPRLYQVLSQFFRQNPMSRVPREREFGIER